jgi:3-oxoacyl-[acyl-carrier-protein] synthase II
VVVASAIGGVSAFQDAVTAMFNDGPRKISPFTIPMLTNGAASLVSIDRGYKGRAFR